MLTEIERLRGELAESVRKNESFEDAAKHFRKELAAERGAVRILAHGYTQCRGALILDHMTQSNGLPYGTTNEALEYGSVVNANPIASAAIAKGNG